MEIYCFKCCQILVVAMCNLPNYTESILVSQSRNNFLVQYFQLWLVTISSNEGLLLWSLQMTWAERRRKWVVYEYWVVYYVLMMSENQKFIDFTRSHPNRNWTSDELVMDSKFAREKENLCLTLIIIPHVLNYSVHMRQCYQLLGRFSKYWNIVKSANQLIVLFNCFFFFLGWKTKLATLTRE